MKTDPEPFVELYGEKWRRLITRSLKWLDRAEPKWKLNKPIGRKSFIKELVGNAKKGERAFKRIQKAIEP